MIKNNSLIIFFWLFLGINYFLNSQNCREKHLEIRNHSTKANEFDIDKLLFNCNKNIKDNIETAHYASIYFYKKKNYKLAIKYAKKEANYFAESNIKGEKHENAIYNLGRFYFFNKEYDNAINSYNKLIKLNTTRNKVARSYGELGRCYRQKGELHKALNYSKKGIDLLEKSKNYTSLYSLYINTSNIYNLIDSKESALECSKILEKAYELVKIERKLQTQKKYSRLNISLGHIYSTLHETSLDDKLLKEQYFKRSKFHFKKVLKTEIFQNDSINFFNSYIGLSHLYINEKKDSALFFLQKSLDFNQKSSSARYFFNKSISYNNVAKFYLQKKLYAEGLFSINKSLNYILNSNDKKVFFSPTELRLLESDNRKHIFSYLKNKIKILTELFIETKDNNYLQQAIKTVDTSDNLVNIILDYSSESNNKLLWREKASEAYLLGTKAAFLLNDTKTMFYFMEKNKALLLLQDIKQNVVQTSLPKNITDKRISLRKDILQLEDFINKQQKNDTYTKEKDSLFFLKKQYETFNDSLKIVYPDHYNTKSDINILDLKTVKKKLEDNTFVISYISNKIGYKEEALFGLAISKHKEFAFEVENYDKFIDDIKTYSNLIKRPFKTTTEINQFKKVSYNLYNKLFPNDSLKEAIKGKNLIIIPDVTFENIPFEAFSTNTNDLTYLIENHTISYAYSCSFLEQNKAIKRNTTENFTAFAPINFKNKTLKALVATENEVSAINNSIKGKLFLNDNATKDAFLKNSANCKVIHLATHAKSSNNPEIYFTADTLKLHELYTHKINADLVTLSACETNLGEINQGEGVFSLARGFFYSGANAVVSSLWNVNDTSTSFLMKDFYENLANKQSKVAALSNAKRKYLKEHSLSDRSPYYWASFVLIGDTGKTFDYSYYLYALSILILIILVLLLVRN